MFVAYLWALHGSPVAERAIPLAVDLIQHSGEVLILLRVVAPNACEPAAGIVASTREDRADLAVMVTHARTGPDRWLHGSVSTGLRPPTSW